MKLLEYRSKEALAKYGLPVTTGTVINDVAGMDDAIAGRSYPLVLKAQVPVGGRGKAGGVKLVNTREEALEEAERILSLEIKGIAVQRLLVAEAVDISREYYLGVVLDRAAGKPLMMGSGEGGVDIEETARTNPDAILRLHLPPGPPRPYVARQMAYFLFEEQTLAKSAVPLVLNLWRAYTEMDAELAEINPLVLTREGGLACVDAKVVIDDSALFRQKELAGLEDPLYINRTEVDAKKAGLSYIRLDGSIGCCVNGAGLAMATMDVIKHFGGEPANFLDVGGSSSPDKIVNAMNIITADPNVRSVFINIFGGITRCDDIAEGLITVYRKGGFDLPVVMRLVGTNEERAKEMVEQSELPITMTPAMADGAKRAVELASAPAAG